MRYNDGEESGGQVKMSENAFYISELQARNKRTSENECASSIRNNQPGIRKSAYEMPNNEPISSAALVAIGKETNGQRICNGRVFE